MNKRTILTITIFLGLAYGAFCLADDGIPDLLSGEGPDPAAVKKAKQDWFLHFWGTRGWIYGRATPAEGKARQILITDVPFQSPARRDLKVGDVILGVEGKRFDRQPIVQFREKAKANPDNLSLIMWRKGWPEPRTVVVEPALSFDLTKGDEVDLSAVFDWNLGATGARGWIMGDTRNHTRKSRQILITKVAEGSPADGILQKSDVIVGIDGELFAGDARKAFAEALTQAETREGQGVLKLARWRAGQTETVALNLNILGSYSETSPWDCEKSDRIVDNACAYLIRNGIPGRGVTDGKGILGTLALMSTGNKNYMPLVKHHINELLAKVKSPEDKLPGWGYDAWGWGYANLLLCEYYLLTQDEAVLPAIARYSEAIALGQSGVGTWGHSMADANKHGNGGNLHGRLGGYGAMNQSSLTLMISLALAEKCGIRSPEISQAIARGNAFFRLYLDQGEVPYGDFLPNRSVHDDNGKCGSAAILFDVEKDKTAADYFCRMSAASFNSIEGGHTGHFFSFLWGPLGAGRGGKAMTGAYMQRISWLHDLERRWDGGFVYQGVPSIGSSKQNHSYKGMDTTGARVLMYCLPRRNLYITGKESVIEPFSTTKVAETVMAGDVVKNLRFHAPEEEPYTREQLMELLGSWSPIVRHRVGEALAAEDGVVPQMIAMLDSSDRYKRFGGLEGLRYTRHPTPESVDAVIQKGLKSEDRAFRLQAIMAFTAKQGGIKTIADPAVPELLKLAVEKEPDDPRGTVARYVAYALFSSSGGTEHVFGIFNRGEGIERIDRRLLYPALKALMKTDDGRARSGVGSIYPKLTADDLAVLWPSIYQATVEIPQSGIMFADSIRAAGLRLLQNHNVKEGASLCAAILNEDRWGRSSRYRSVLPILRKYAEAAKVKLPENGKIDPRNAKQMEDLVKAIESSPAIPFVSIDQLIAGSTEK